MGLYYAPCSSANVLRTASPHQAVSLLEVRSNQYAGGNAFELDVFAALLNALERIAELERRLDTQSEWSRTP